MNGFLVFDSQQVASECLLDPVVRNLGAAQASFRRAASKPVITFRNVPEPFVDTLLKTARAYGAEVEESFRHEPVTSY
jgi:hypothetical protein